MQTRLQQAPVRNASVVAASVYSHSGDFSPQAVDLAFPGRGLSVAFTRKYRSALSQTIAPLGRGWTFTYAKSIERENDALLYHDGYGRTHPFTQVDGQEIYTAPELYAVLTSQKNRFFLQGRYGAILTFEAPED